MIARRGFTLIEVLVSIVLIELGLLSSLAALAIMARAANEGRLTAAAAARATARLEVLRLSPCAASAGESPPAPMREFWVATPRHNGVRDLSDSVEYRVGGRTRALVLRTRDVC